MLLTLNVVVIFAWPWAFAGARDVLGPVYGWLCHRLPERTYWLLGEPMPVCARCLGVWLGLAVMALVAACASVWRLRTGLALLACMAVSWLLGSWLPASWHAERTLAGLLGGLGLYVVVAQGWRRFCRQCLTICRWREKVISGPSARAFRRIGV